MKPAPDDFLTIDELAAMLQVSKDTIYTWRKTRQGPAAHKIGRHLRFRRRDIEAWLAAQRDDQ